VMVTRENRVKILDFGLALIGAPSSVADVTLTSAGLIVGTVPYMSPEQARGAPVDYRTDQFSFGVTLYEMVTGSRAFQADTAAQTLAAILEDEPESIAKLNPRVPAPLRWVIERCLAKDPRQRYESTTDLSRELCTLRDRLGEFSPAADPEVPAVPRRRRLAAAMLIGATGLAVAIGAIGLRGSVTEPGLDRYRFTPFATDAGYQSSPAWSPDGRTLAYVAAADGVLQVFTKAVGSPLRLQVTHCRFDCRDVFWGSDGTRLYYTSLARDRDGLWSISSVGGEPDLVMENVSRAALSPDGKTLALLRAPDTDNEYGGVKTLWLSSPPGSTPVAYARGTYVGRRFFEGTIHFSPDSSKLGLWMTALLPAKAGSAGRPSVSELWVLPIQGGMPVHFPSPVADSPNYASAFSWLPDSRHIVSAIPYPRPGVHLWITDTHRSSSWMITASGNVENDPAVSPDGLHLATTLQQANYDIYRLSIDHPALEPALASGRNEMDPAWSPKASQMAYTTDRSGSDEIWLRSQNGDFERPLVTPQDFSGQTYLLSSPEFSPDGQRIAYYREGSTGNRIWISPVAGGPPVELARSDAAQDLPSWSPDGAWIAFPMDSGGIVGRWSLVKMRVGAKVAPETLVADIAPISPVKWSPSGEWIAYNGQNGLALVSADGRSNRPMYDEPLIAFAWSEDNRRLYGIRQSDDYKHLTFTSIDVESRSETVISQDFMAMPVAAQPVRGFARVSARSFMTSIVHVSSDIWLLDGFARPSSVWDRWAGLLRVPGR